MLSSSSLAVGDLLHTAGEYCIFSNIIKISNLRFVISHSVDYNNNYLINLVKKIFKEILKSEIQ